MLYLSVHDRSGNILERFSDVLSLTSKKVVNGVGIIKFTVLANHPSTPHLDYLNIIQLHRKEARYGLGWYQENIGIILDRKFTYTTNHAPILEVTAMHPNYLLSTRIVAYVSGVTNRSKFIDTQAETIAKALVIWNATSAAGLDAHRLRDGSSTLYPIQVQVSADAGPRVDFFCSLHSLLSALQRLAAVGAGDFNLVDIGAGRFEFRWYNGQLGAPRSDSVLFALSRGNMANPVYAMFHSQEATVAFACGQGEGVLRQFAIQYAENFTVDVDIESFVYGIHAATHEGLVTIAENHLAKQGFIPTLTFDVVQTPSTFYGKHYFLGDLVSVHNPYTGQVFTTKINAVTLTIAAINERKDIPALVIGGGVQIAISLASADDEMLNPWLISSIQESIYTENVTNPTLDGVQFTDIAFNYHLDGAGFSDDFLAESIDAGLFAPPPG